MLRPVKAEIKCLNLLFQLSPIMTNLAPQGTERSDGKAVRFFISGESMTEKKLRYTAHTPTVSDEKGLVGKAEEGI